jgi:hypothetical protein
MPRPAHRPEILKQQAEAYRRLRNTLRYLLGASTASRIRARLAPAEMPELERWVLHRLAELDAKVREAGDDFDFHALFTELHNFCAVDLSAFYFDIRKDALYCDRPDACAAARPHRARRGVLVPHRLAGADPLLHRRGGLARARHGRRRGERASARLPTLPAEAGGRGAGGEMGARSATSAASSPARWNWHAPRRRSAPACRRCWQVSSASGSC